MELAVVVCFKENGKEICRIKESDNNNFPGGGREFLDWVEEGWNRHSHITTYRTKV